MSRSKLAALLVAGLAPVWCGAGGLEPVKVTEGMLRRVAPDMALLKLKVVGTRIQERIVLPSERPTPNERYIAAGEGRKLVVVTLEGVAPVFYEVFSMRPSHFAAVGAAGLLGGERSSDWGRYACIAWRVASGGRPSIPWASADAWVTQQADVTLAPIHPKGMSVTLELAFDVSSELRSPFGVVIPTLAEGEATLPGAPAGPAKKAGE